MQALAEQVSLFGSGEPRLDPRLPGLRRLALGAGAWVDHLPGWLEGHDAVFETLRRTTRWEHHRRRMYERVVDVPRLVAELPEDGPGHPVLVQAAEVLSRRYGLALARISLAYYRDGRDSVAWHGDRLGRLVDDTVVATCPSASPGGSCCAPPPEARRAPSSWAGATSWRWAGAASGRGSTPSRRPRLQGRG